MVNNDHCEVQGTSRKGLFPTLSRCSRCNLEDGCNNQDIRDKDQYHRPRTHRLMNKVIHFLMVMSAQKSFTEGQMSQKMQEMMLVSQKGRLNTEET